MRITKILTTGMIGGMFLFAQVSCSQQGGGSGNDQEKEAKEQSSKPQDQQAKERGGSQSGSPQGSPQGAPQMGGGQTDIDVSDEELKKFVEINKKLRPLQNEARQEMRKNVENSELGMKRYQEISRARQQGSKADVSDKEQKQLDELQKKNQKVQKANQEKIRKKVEEEGLKWDRFMKISQAIRQDPKLKQKAMKMMQPKGGGGAPQKRQKQGSPQGGGGR